MQRRQSVESWTGLECDDLEIIQDNRSFIAKKRSDSCPGRSSWEVPVELKIVAGLRVNPGGQSEPLAVCFHESVALGDSLQFHLGFFGNLDLEVSEKTSFA